MKEHIDVKIKSWGNGSSSGPWIKMDLFSEEDLEVLKNHVGKGFHMILVPEQVDESEDLEEDEAVGFIPPEGDFKVALCTSGNEKPKTTARDSVQSALMCKSPEFWRYLSTFDGSVVDEATATDYFRKWCQIESRAELDTSETAKRFYIGIRDDFRKWVNRGEVA